MPPVHCTVAGDLVKWASGRRSSISLFTGTILTGFPNQETIFCNGEIGGEESLRNRRGLKGLHYLVGARLVDSFGLGVFLKEQKRDAVGR